MDTKETKICKTCGIEKTIDNFNKGGFTPDGKQYYKPTCRNCNLKNKGKGKSKLMNKQNITAPNTSKQIENCICEFTKEEIIKLKQWLQDDTITNNKIMNSSPDITISNHKFDKKSRIKATYNIEKDIKSRLDQYCKTKLQNNSDIVNIALLEFLDKHV
jgi:hypothetical protein